MPAKITRAEVGGWKQRALRLRSKMASNREAATQTIETVVHTTEVSSAAFLAGIVQGRYGGIELLGVPLDLGLAVALHVGAFVGLAGKASPHLHGFGDGFLAAFLTATGSGVGDAWLEKADPAAWALKHPGRTPQTATSGALPGGGGRYLTEVDRGMAGMDANM